MCGEIEKLWDIFRAHIELATCKVGLQVSPNPGSFATPKNKPWSFKWGAESDRCHLGMLPLKYSYMWAWDSAILREWVSECHSIIHHFGLDLFWAGLSLRLTQTKGESLILYLLSGCTCYIRWMKRLSERAATVQCQTDRINGSLGNLPCNVPLWAFLCTHLSFSII